jgi:transposase
LILPGRILVAVAPVDMRLGADGLSLKLQALGADPFDGSAYLFTNKRGNRLKLLAWDGNGVWLCQRRLHKGHFTWPRPGVGFSTCPPRSGNGWLRGWTGSGWRRFCRSVQSFEISPQNRPKPSIHEACGGIQWYNAAMNTPTGLIPLNPVAALLRTAVSTPEDTLAEVGRLQSELAAARQTIAEKDAVLLAAEIEIQSLIRSKEALKAAELKIQALALELAHHKRMRFGQKSEALAAGQRELFEETAACDLSAIEAELEQARNALNPKLPRKPRARAGRQPLPPHLPRVEHRHEPQSCTCGQCGSELVKIGEDPSAGSGQA